MNEYLQNIEKSLQCDVPILTLIGTFAAIDIIAALDSEDGITSTLKFKQWFEKFLPGYLGKATSNDYHNFRCGLLHQLAGGRKGDSFHSLIFYPTESQIQAHLSVFSIENEKYFSIKLTEFVADVIKAIRKCVNESSNYEKHKDSIITLHPNGIPALNWIGTIHGKPPAVIASAKMESMSPKKFLKKEKNKDQGAL
ncbi:MAG: hypothetical protein KGZ39_03980 [Simkania sp.]|nr:hypothetical protein [Simkania sp.]